MNFENLQIKSEIVQALKEEGIINPTDIQAKSIPLIKEGKDVVGISRTGSGKTAAFGIPLLEKVVPRKGVQALILSPTRELTNQIAHELQKWSKHLNLGIAAVFGGVSLEPQREALARSEIVVGTPGRIVDHLSRRNLDLSKLKMFVLDEADKMVDMGFIEPIEKILSVTPKQKQMVLFGATISDEIDHLKKRYMNNVVKVETELQVEKDLLKQFYYDVKTHEKFSLLVHLLRKESTDRVIIFCSKRTTVELIHKNLRLQGIKAGMIHGKMRQNKRLDVINQFNKGKVNILVASAVAARGLDIKDISHVFNYDLSNDPQEYVHRVGRTARAGESGKAITLLSEQDHDNFGHILSRNRIEVEALPLENFDRLRFDRGQQQQHFNGFAPGRAGRNSYEGTRTGIRRPNFR